jgi:hypothetical protein
MKEEIMKHRALTLGLPLLILAALVLLATGSNAGKGGKIPITTKSEKAREYYLKGLDLAERLRGQQAFAYFEKAVAEDPGFAMAYLNLALVTPSTAGFFENLGKA